MNKLSPWLIIATSMPALAANPPATSAYYQDNQNTYVHDQTSEGIKSVNNITCYIASMRPDAMVNTGDYIAFIDDAKCNDSNRSNASNSTNTNSGSSAAQYTSVTVNSSRTSNNVPMIVKAWVDSKPSDGGATIFAHLSATESPSSSNPYGSFRLDYCQKMPNAPSCAGKGYMQSSASNGLSFYETGTGGGGGSARTVAVQLTSTSTSAGSGRMSMTENNTTSAFDFAYDANHFLRSDGSTQACFERTATNADYSVWRYGLYDTTTGARLNRNAGFPVDYTNGGTTYHGYIGYWGLSMPVSVPNGATLNKVSYNQGSAPTTQAYTLQQSAGKLYKYTKQTRSLASMDQIRFTAGVFLNNSFHNYEMYWDNTASHFVLTATQTCSSNGCFSTALPSTQTLSLATIASNMGGLRGWSQTLGGELFVDVNQNNVNNAGSINVYYRTQDMIYPQDMTALGDLVCVKDCMTPATINGFTGSNSPYDTNSQSWGGNSNPITYTLNSSTGNLQYNSADVAVTSANTAFNNTPYHNGLRTGALVSAGQLAQLSCSGSTAPYCDKASALDVYYVWETGTNNWNQFTALKDGNGHPVKFDPPLMVNYTVPNNSARFGAYAGKTIALNYSGFGELQGIPGKCVNTSDNQVVDCSTANGSNAVRWVPEFYIDAGELVNVQGASTNYLVKWLDREARLHKVNLAQCSALSLPNNNTVTLPTAIGLQDTTNPSSSVYIGNEPIVTTPPKVIQGVVQ